MKTKAGNQNRFSRIVTVPFRALGKARDFYVRSVICYATKIGSGSSYMGTTSENYYSMDLPRSFSVNDSMPGNDDLRDLIRAASAKSLADRIDVNDLMLQEQMTRQLQHPGSKLGAVGPKVMPPRSQSVCMARIDEEKPYAAEEITSGNRSKKPRKLFSRSKSHGLN